MLINIMYSAAVCDMIISVHVSVILFNLSHAVSQFLCPASKRMGDIYRIRGRCPSISLSVKTLTLSITTCGPLRTIL